MQRLGVDCGIRRLQVTLRGCWLACRASGTTLLLAGGDTGDAGRRLADVWQLNTSGGSGAGGESVTWSQLRPEGEQHAICARSGQPSSPSCTHASSPARCLLLGARLCSDQACEASDLPSVQIPPLVRTHRIT